MGAPVPLAVTTPGAAPAPQVPITAPKVTPQQHQAAITAQEKSISQYDASIKQVRDRPRVRELNQKDRETLKKLQADPKKNQAAIKKIEADLQLREKGSRISMRARRNTRV